MSAKKRPNSYAAYARTARVLVDPNYSRRVARLATHPAVSHATEEELKERVQGSAVQAQLLAYRESERRRFISWLKRAMAWKNDPRGRTSSLKWDVTDLLRRLSKQGDVDLARIAVIVGQKAALLEDRRKRFDDKPRRGPQPRPGFEERARKLLDQLPPGRPISGHLANHYGKAQSQIIRELHRAGIPLKK